MNASSVRTGPSAIHATGVFVQQRTAAGQTIGALDLGPAQEQGRHTLLVGTEHRSVAEPWRFLNHACTPTAQLRFIDRDAILVAARDLEPGTELTIDYLALPEKVGSPFTCGCVRCREAPEPSRVGG
jgi:SET domain